MRLATGIALAGVGLIFTTWGQAACPVGSHSWVDQWGNQICRRMDTGQTTTIQGSPSDCPTGTHPWLDKWGNSICKGFNDGQQYHDTSKGCPTGSHSWVDDWGNRICKFF